MGPLTSPSWPGKKAAPLGTYKPLLLLPSRTSLPLSLSLGTVDIWDQIILAWGLCGWLFIGTPDLDPLGASNDARRPPPCLSQDNQKCLQVLPAPPGEHTMAPVESLCLEWTLPRADTWITPALSTENQNTPFPCFLGAPEFSV